MVEILVKVFGLCEKRKLIKLQCLYYWNRYRWGSILPEYINGKKVGFIKDENGSPVVSKLNSVLWKKTLQLSSNGKYYEVNNLKG